MRFRTTTTVVTEVEYSEDAVEEYLDAYNVTSVEELIDETKEDNEKAVQQFFDDNAIVETDVSIEVVNG